MSTQFKHILYFVYFPTLCKNLKSPFVKYLMSLMKCLIATSLEIPIPNAKPLYSFGSTPACVKTSGWIIPAPRSSIRPVFLHKLHHFWSQIGQLASISKPGSTNGKYAGLIRIIVSFSKIAVKNCDIIFLK